MCRQLLAESATQACCSRQPAAVPTKLLPSKHRHSFSAAANGANTLHTPHVARTVTHQGRPTVSTAAGDCCQGVVQHTPADTTAAAGAAATTVGAGCCIYALPLCRRSFLMRVALGSRLPPFTSYRCSSSSSSKSTTQSVTA